MTLVQKNICGWDGYHWENGDISLGIVPPLGGRIMSLQFCGEEILFVQEEHRGEVFDLKELMIDKKEFGFRVWGGDKTWIAPERSWVDKIPPLDLDAGKYEFAFDKNKVTMTSAVCRETGLRITREIELYEDNKIVLTETIKNETAAPIQRGIWNVTQILRPFDIFVPSLKKNVRLYEDEAFKDCPIQKYLSEESGWTKISCFDNAHFKFGTLMDQGKVRALRPMRNSILEFIKTFPVDSKARYAHDSCLEIYNSPIHNYCEIEVHSPLIMLDPGQSFSQEQQWHLKRFLL